MKDLKRYHGFWWLSDKPTEKLSGELTISTINEFKLSLYFLASSDLIHVLIPSLNEFHYKSIPIINGIVKESQTNIDTEFTLFNCELETYLINKTSELTYSVSFMIEGANVVSKNKLLFKKLFLQPIFIDQWAIENHISISNDDHKKKFNVKADYEQPEHVNIYKNGNLTIYIYFRARYQTEFNSSFTIKQTPILNIEFSRKQSIKKTLEIIDLVKNWFVIVYGMPVYYETISCNCIVNQSRGQSNELINVNLHQSVNFNAIKYKKYYKAFELIPYLEFKIQLRDFFNNWYKKYNLLKPVIGLYVDTLFNDNLYPQNQFLNYVFALEIYHRTLTPNQSLSTDIKTNNKLNRIISNCHPKDREWLNKRLKVKSETLKNRLIQLFKEYDYISQEIGLSKQSYIEKIATTRNHFVHNLGPDSKNGLLNLDSIQQTTDRLLIILQAIFLQEMGMSKESIVKNIKRSGNNSKYFVKNK